MLSWSFLLSQKLCQIILEFLLLLVGYVQRGNFVRKLCDFWIAVQHDILKTIETRKFLRIGEKNL